MIHFIFSEHDTRYLFLKYDSEYDEINLKKLKDHLNLVDPICYLATYHGPPFTQDFLYTYVQPSGQVIYYCAIGLWQEIYLFFKENDIPFDGLLDHSEVFKRNIPHTFDQFKTIVDSWELKYLPRPYQYEAAYKILNWKQSVSELATRAGKTLIAYMIFRYCIEYLGAKRILMIVPSIQLVTQGYNDFKEYAEFFNTECVWGGGKLVESANLTIGTFQSLIKFLDKGTKSKPNKKYNPDFFNGYDIVFVDETHRATANQIKTIISQPFMKNVKIAFGMTGTIPKKKTIEYYCLKSLLGATIQEIKPKYLMDEGYISKVNITQVRLHYKDIEKAINHYILCAEYALSEFITEDKINRNGKKVQERIKLTAPQFQIQFKKKLPMGINEMRLQFYEDTDEGKKNWIQTLKTYINMSESTNSLVVERMVSHFMTERIDYLCNNILAQCDKNTLVLAHHTEYINYITDIIKKRFPNKHIDTITGAVSPKRREEIKQMLKDNNDCILIASYGTLSTGITLSNLCYGVLFESFKSDVINMQSIGRGLGLSELKDEFILFDVIDCFDRKILSNKIYLQGLAKCKKYDIEQYPYKIINVNI
jgi:superfamily II DNA or RNA helicase